MRLKLYWNSNDTNFFQLWSCCNRDWYLNLPFIDNIIDIRSMKNIDQQAHILTLITVHSIMTDLAIHWSFLSSHLIINICVFRSKDRFNFQINLLLLIWWIDLLTETQSYQQSCWSKQCVQDAFAHLFMQIHCLNCWKYSSMLQMHETKIDLKNCTSWNARSFLHIARHWCSSDSRLTSCVQRRFCDYFCD